MGDASDPRLAWLVDRSTGARMDVEWPHGYRARFTPGIEILDSDGLVALRAGDQVSGACVGALDGPLLLVPPFDE